MSDWRHGHNTRTKRSPTYQSWSAMKLRCLNPNYKKFYLYGGRGIKVCDRWVESFENFLADMGQRPEGKTLDRYPNKDGNYEPGNCRWATQEEQHSNRNKYVRGRVAKTHCPAGHEYAGENLYFNPRTRRRFCKTCKSASQTRIRNDRRIAHAFEERL